MPIKIVMPTANTAFIAKLRAHVHDPKAEINALYRSTPPGALTRQAMIFIANSAPKMIKPKDKVFILVVNNPVLMAMISARVTDRINRLFSRNKRRWYLLEYEPKSKTFIEYYLP